ncbi:response regulator transcription factor [Intestinimonas sp. MSJ-38]|uniref:response regulator transcription factor n=1 Tax=Intestinimonas sp. MSJ-38 TaxID=2841532 RepID=UPI000E54032F|nr:response regulator transcription factor [Intestinimonas sp. MSJ-38]MBU5432114.1 response regulator transcription factor [Intestinimonas sp. MSJ-38]RHT73278.1 DNA-binding response regulator [Ruminococcaceae bacterium AM28-23LB]
MRVLVVDDEKLLVKGIKFNLENDGYQVDTAYDGAQALSMVKEQKYDIIILDLMLPEVDGLEVCRKIRENSNVPVIMLTAKSEGVDKLIGFEYGADDYVTKPFDILELKARIRAILRRAGSQPAADLQDDQIKVGDLLIDTAQRSVFKNGRATDLTAKEFDLLVMLARNPGRVFSREGLLSVVWGEDYPGDIRTVDVHVRRLREKLETDDANPEYILTKWGVGYYFKPNSSAQAD